MVSPPEEWCVRTFAPKSNDTRAAVGHCLYKLTFQAPRGRVPAEAGPLGKA
jgi:hypothetical protein